MDTLTAMEQIEVDNKDRPIQDIVIEVAQVFVDPFSEAEEQVGISCYTKSLELTKIKFVT